MRKYGVANDALNKENEHRDSKMLDNLKGKHVMLTSGSPRRQELLRAIGVEFEVVTKAGVAETYPETLNSKDVAEYIANEKADAYAADLKAGDILITTDTVVVLDKEILGKPKDADDAKRMLRSLSGRKHKVITGVSIVTRNGRTSFSVETKVTMRTLTDDAIEYYVTTAKPIDKAGSYGIQEWIGLVGIDYIEGSYQNVMGLPTQRLYAELCTIGN